MVKSFFSHSVISELQFRKDKKDFLFGYPLSNFLAVFTGCGKESFEPVSQKDDAFSFECINMSSTFLRSRSFLFKKCGVRKLSSISRT